MDQPSHALECLVADATISDGALRPSPALFAALYEELHRVARRELHRGPAAATLGATTLLHETYLRLLGNPAVFADRARFFAYAARAMRGLVIDYARARRAIKRGGEFHFTSWQTDEAGAVPDNAGGEVLDALGDALNTLASLEPALAELVDLKYFCGLEFAQIAELRGVNERTVRRHWDKARLFLRQWLHED